MYLGDENDIYGGFDTLPGRLPVADVVQQFINVIIKSLLAYAMGLDVHRDIIVACLAKEELRSDPEIEIRSFSTLIPEMRKPRNWMI